MRKLWKLSIVILASVMLAGTVVGIVVAQTDSDPARPFSNFLSQLAENLGITEATLEEAIDQTSLEIVDEKEAAGDLTTEQADRIRERIASGEGLPFFGGFGHGRGFGHGFGGCRLGLGHLGAGLDLPLERQFETSVALGGDDVARPTDPRERAVYRLPALGHSLLQVTAPPVRGASVEEQLPPGGFLAGCERIRALGVALRDGGGDTDHDRQAGDRATQYGSTHQWISPGWDVSVTKSPAHIRQDT